MMKSEECTISFDCGTLVVEGVDADRAQEFPYCRWDDRTETVRAEARWYRHLIEHLRKNDITYLDKARTYDTTPWTLHVDKEPFPHQTEALQTWWDKGARGVVVLPTGTGKTHLAVLAIQRIARPAMVVTPTIDLLNQWYAELETAFEAPVGLLGGGYFDLQPLTVTTYDSAFLHVERWGDQYGLIVFDECHHLPGPSFQMAAVGCIAPFRLGLTATPERADGQEYLLPQLIGPTVYRRDIQQLAGEFLAEYRVQQLTVEHTEEEKERYQKARQQYRRFVEQNGISMGGPSGWQRFIQASCRSPEGRAAFQAYREQKQLALAAPAKINLLGELLQRHSKDRVLIFTYDNASVYRIARRFLVPAITHQTKTRERQDILKRFHAGDYNVVVTSQVLNEGVDVPSANVGVILSGTGSVREHVQRLGRLLRKQGDKQATLYEVVTRDTAEEFTSERRRQHQAYQ